MRRYLLPGLIALTASNVFVYAATPSAPPAPAAQQQPFRKLEFSRIGPWEVAVIGNDEKVNHCALTRATSSAELKPGEPKFTVIADAKWMIARVRDTNYRFTERKALELTAITPDGREMRPPA